MLLAWPYISLKINLLLRKPQNSSLAHVRVQNCKLWELKANQFQWSSCCKFSALEKRRQQIAVGLPEGEGYTEGEGDREGKGDGDENFSLNPRLVQCLIKLQLLLPLVII